MDLGGIVSSPQQVVESDRLGPADGEYYELRFFFAQRFHAAPAFHLRTNLRPWSEAAGETASFPRD